MKNLQTNHGELLVADFERVIKNSEIISFNENFIEVPGIVLFTKEKKKTNIIQRLLNPGVEVIEVDEKLFGEMINSLKAHESEEFRISFDSKTLPVKTTIINLDQLKERAIFVRVIGDSITVNDIVFTNNEAEYHGDGMFTTKKVYFIDFDKMAKVKNMFYK